jgi:hypothetical protein
VSLIGVLLRAPEADVEVDDLEDLEPYDEFVDIGDELDEVELDPGLAPDLDELSVPDDQLSPIDGGRPSSRLMRPSVILPIVVGVLAAVVMVGVAEMRGSAGPGVGEAIVSVDGLARVVRVDGRVESVTGRTRLHPGDRIDLRRGTASFELNAGVRYDGRGPSGAGDERLAGTSVLMGRTPELRAGPLLVQAGGGGATLAAGRGTVRLASGAVARVDRTYAVRASAYRGDATLSSAGASRTVTALRSIDLSGPGEIGDVAPVVVDGQDPWAREFLADAVTLDSQLRPLASGLRAERVDGFALIGAVRDELADPPSVKGLQRMIGHRPIRLDLGIALAVIGNGARGTIGERWGRAMAFRDLGASWGLVAMDIHAKPADVTSTLRAAIDAHDLPSISARNRAAGITSSSPLRAGIDANGDGRPDAPGASGSSGSGSGPGNGTGSGGNEPGGPITGVTEPTIPGVTTPGGVTIPGVTVPGVTNPSGGVTVPGASIPGTGITTPPITIPGVTLPATPAIPIVTDPITTITSILPPVGTVVGGILPGLTTTTQPHHSGTTTTTRPTVTLPILPGLGL